MNQYRYLIGGVLWFLTQAGLAQDCDSQDFKSRFFSESSFGDIAVVLAAQSPTEAKQLCNFQILSRQQANILDMPSSGILYVAVNHKVDDWEDLLTGQLPTFIAVDAIIIYPEFWSEANRLNLFRNKEWARPGDLTARRREPFQDSYPDIDIVAFAGAHSKADFSLKQVDQLLDTKFFHGLPYNGKTATWDALETWSYSPDKERECQLDIKRCRISALALRYEPTVKSASDNVPVFGIGVSSAEKLNLRIGLPAKKFAGYSTYSIVFK